MCTTVYYPRIGKLMFYGDDGVLAGGILGDYAKVKFHRLLRSGKFPRISLRKKVRIALRGGAR